MKKQRPAPITWRPTADSFRNLLIFWAVLGLAALPGAIVVAGPGVTAALLIAAALGGLAVTLTMSRARMTRALEGAGHPQLGNWPPRPRDRARARRAGWVNAGRAGAGAAVAGGLVGFVPLLGAGVVAAGWAGAIGTTVLWRTVRRYERTSGSFVVTARPERSDRRRTALELGLVRQPAS
jgi:hypothetical protein